MIKTVTCCNNCSLLDTSGYTMYCAHPSLKTEADAHIVTRDNRHTVPEKCPLRLGPLYTTTRLELMREA